MLRVRGSQSRVLSHTHLPFISQLQRLVTLRTDWGHLCRGSRSVTTLGSFVTISAIQLCKVVCPFQEKKRNTLTIERKPERRLEQYSTVQYPSRVHDRPSSQSSLAFAALYLSPFLHSTTVSIPRRSPPLNSRPCSTDGTCCHTPPLIPVREPLAPSSHSSLMRSLSCPFF